MSIVAADEIASLSSSSPPLGWARTAGGPAAGTLQAVRRSRAQCGLAEGRRESVYYLLFASQAGSGGSVSGPKRLHHLHSDIIIIIYHRHNHDYHKGENRKVGVNLC